MNLKSAILAAALTVIAAPAFAQEASFKNPSPVDFSKPFLYDGVFVRPAAEDSALQVEIINKDRRLQLGDPTTEELLRSLDSSKGTGTSTINLRNLGDGRTLIMLNPRRLPEDPGKADEKPGAE